MFSVLIFRLAAFFMTGVLTGGLFAGLASPAIAVTEKNEPAKLTEEKCGADGACLGGVAGFLAGGAGFVWLIAGEDALMYIETYSDGLAAVAIGSLIVWSGAKAGAAAGRLVSKACYEAFNNKPE